jgi:acyl-CoA reductase-like NAD-dependent aldehyde dehydrogenase
VDSTGKIVDVINPATGKVIGKCPISTKDEINAAVDAAKAAFPD